MEERFGLHPSISDSIGLRWGQSSYLHVPRFTPMLLPWDHTVRATDPKSPRISLVCASSLVTCTTMTGRMTACFAVILTRPPSRPGNTRRSATSYCLNSTSDREPRTSYKSKSTSNCLTFPKFFVLLSHNLLSLQVCAWAPFLSMSE